MIGRLPQPIVHEIFAFHTKKELVLLQRVSKRFKSDCMHRSLWQIVDMSMFKTDDFTVACTRMSNLFRPSNVPCTTVTLPSWCSNVKHETMKELVNIAPDITTLIVPRPNNNISGHLKLGSYSALAKLSNLADLQIPGQWLCNATISNIGKCTSLKKLDVTGCSFRSATGISSLSALTTLTELTTTMYVTDADAQHLASRMSNLTSLTLSTAPVRQLTEAGVKCLATHPTLSALKIHARSSITTPMFNALTSGALTQLVIHGEFRYNQSSLSSSEVCIVSQSLLSLDVREHSLPELTIVAPSLKKLFVRCDDLSFSWFDCPMLTDATLQIKNSNAESVAMVTASPLLRVLRLTTHDMHRISLCNNSLDDVTLSGHKLLDLEVHCNNLRSLHLLNCYGLTSLKVNSNQLVVLKLMTDLLPRQCVMFKMTLLHLHTPKLAELDMNIFLGLKDLQVESLLMKSIDTSSIRLDSLVLRCPSLLTLKLWLGNIENATALEIIRGCPLAQVVELQSAYMLTDETIELMIAQLPGLRRLKICDSKATVIRACNNTLTELVLANMHVMTGVYLRCSSLHKLQLIDCPTMSGAMTFDIPSGCPQLRDLALSNCNLTSIAVKGEHLHKLSVMNCSRLCGISIDAANMQGFAASNCPKLTLSKMSDAFINRPLACAPLKMVVIIKCESLTGDFTADVPVLCLKFVENKAHRIILETACSAEVIRCPSIDAILCGRYTKTLTVTSAPKLNMISINNPISLKMSDTPMVNIVPTTQDMLRD